ncbi:MAG: ribosome small subunit-dependent GTPase A [Ignavibacteriaceae bacterium]
MAFLFLNKLGKNIKGLVTRIESKDYYIHLPETQKIIRCGLRGKFKKDFNLKKDKLYSTGIVVVGDKIEFDLNEDGTGIIHKVEKRKNYLSRKAPKIKGSSTRGERLEQVIASNIDNFFIITSIKKPKFNNKVLDRLLVAGESSHLNIIIIINKKDLDDNSEIEFWHSLYSSIGYKVIATSKISREGIANVKDNLDGKKNLFWGQSGVGKSSLLNSMFQHLDLNVGEISSYSEKGKHTTVTSKMIKIDENTFIIDTPGIREIDPYGIRKEDLGHYFIEFKKYLIECRFNTCTHQHEPGCAVIKAVENDKISMQRYDSYLRILETIEEDIIF